MSYDESSLFNSTSTFISSSLPPVAVSTSNGRDFANYTEWQLIGLQYMYLPGAILSFIASLCLLWHISNDDKNKNARGGGRRNNNNGRRGGRGGAGTTTGNGGTYRRLLVGISVIDILSSGALIVIPPLNYTVDTEPGTLCTADTGFQILGGSAPLYMAFLSFYFLLVIRYNVKDDKISRRYEPIFHFISLGFPISIMISGFFYNVYNPLRVNLGCNAQDYPVGCVDMNDVDCIRGESYKTFAAVGGYIPFTLVLISIVTNNGLIYSTIRKIELRNRRYDFQYQHQSQLSSRSQSQAIFNRQSSTRQNNTGSSFPIFAKARGDSTSLNNDSLNGDPERQQQRQQKNKNAPRLNDNNTSNNEKSKKVAGQAILFGTCFFITYFFTIVVYFASVLDPNGLQQAKYVPLQILAGLLWPTQGIFDLLIYIRPKYLMWRQHVSRWEAFMKAVGTHETPTSLPSSTQRHASGGIGGQTATNNNSFNQQKQQSLSNGGTNSSTSRSDLLAGNNTNAVQHHQPASEPQTQPHQSGRRESTTKIQGSHFFGLDDESMLSTNHCDEVG